MDCHGNVLSRFLIWVLKIYTRKGRFVAHALALFVLVSDEVWILAYGLGSMSTIAISYGESGPVFCGLKSDGSHLVSCYGSNSAIIYGTPAHFPFMGLTAGDGFVCGLLLASNQPYCWGSSSFIQMGVPQPMDKGAQYLEISAGDNHLCGLRRGNGSLIDCWGYNMTSSFTFDEEVSSISAGSEFNCGLFARNRSVFCWGDEMSSRVISLIPKTKKFEMIAAGGYHVCGILQGLDSKILCWGRSLDMEEEISAGYTGKGNVDLAPSSPMLSVVGGKFHACGIRSFDRSVVCWGFQLTRSTLPPNGAKVYEIAAGDYFTCGILAEKSLLTICWGSGFPPSLPLAVSPGLCKPKPCSPGFYEFNNSGGATCNNPDSRICLPCSNQCPSEMYPSGECNAESTSQCVYNCTVCVSKECSANCSAAPTSEEHFRLWALHFPEVLMEAVFAVFLVFVVSLVAVIYVRCRLRNCHCSSEKLKPSRCSSNVSKEKIRQELNIRRARSFTYSELERATSGFKEESVVGKGSFSCVFKGVLKDGTMVAVKRAIMSTDMKKKSSSKEFRTELDLLSRLNHAHLLNLLGYCEEGGERLLVYEFMAHGSLHSHLHGKNKSLKEQLDWVKRVTIAVQAARGIEYLHGYACPPVIHRDIKSSNILIDEEHNARVSDFGLSLLGPTDSSSPLAELPAGTLGYLDPEYYRLHYLTTKSDVYSFGVLLLEILSGRKAIDMRICAGQGIRVCQLAHGTLGYLDMWYEEGNVVQWAVPLIKSGEISAILDPVLKRGLGSTDMEALTRIANVACKCVRMRGKDRPSMEKVTTSLERALALLMGNPCSEQPILPTEVVLGSSRMHKKTSQKSSETEEVGSAEFRAPSWITFPSVASSQRRKSSVSEADIDVKNVGSGRAAAAVAADGGLRSLEEEIGPASPQEKLFLKHNF